MRVLTLADSLALPRPHRGQPLEVTWPVLLKKALPHLDVWQRARPASTVYEIFEEYNLFSDSIDCFDVLIFQLGITDCCPRPDPYFIHRFIQYFFSKKVQKFVNSNYQYLLKLRSKPWVSRYDFDGLFRKMIETSLSKSPELKIIIVKIGPPCHELLKKVPQIGKFVEEYNALIDVLGSDIKYRNSLSVVDPYLGQCPELMMISDGHHLTELGHAAVAKSLLSTEVLKKGKDLV